MRACRLAVRPSVPQFLGNLYNFYFSIFAGRAVGGCDNVSGRNGAKDGGFGPVSRVCADMGNGVVLCENEIPWELRSYVELTKENIERTSER